MLKRLFPKSHARLTLSPAAPWLQSFAEWLVAQGYAHVSARNHVSRLNQALEQVRSPIPPDSTFTSHELTPLFIGHGQKSLFKATERAFGRFLQVRELLVDNKEPSPYDELLCDYRAHLTEMRGLVPRTVNQHISTVSEFLAKALPPDGPINSLTPQAVEAFIVEKGQRVTRQSLQHTVARLRSFLRFCFDQEVVSRRLDAIDTPRTYRGELPPRALPWDHVLGLLDSIDRSQMSGCRDHTMLHLMADYGLRPSEIASLTVDSINWGARTMNVEQRKTRTTLVLPLSDESLLVLNQHLHGGRPVTPSRALFLTLRSPIKPVTHYVVCDVYAKHARKSGLPLQGTSSYSLRHSFAMRLLTSGVGIKIIGDLLGHRTLESTCVYLRLHTEALRGVALPVPQGEEVAQ